MLGLFKSALGEPSKPPVPGPFRGICELRPGEAWRSTDGRTVLHLNNWGALTLRLDGKTAWKPPVRARAAKLLLNGRGEMILFSPQSERMWVAGVAGIPDVELRLQEDGNAVLYSGHRALWFSDTRHLEPTAR